MIPPVRITRYPNRRFYAPHESRYVSLQEIEQMVLAGNQVEIRDSQTEEDLTGFILTRIMIDRQPEKMRLIPIDMLHAILRSNDVMSDFLRDYFRHALPYLDYLQRHSKAALNFAQPMHWVKAWLDGIAPRPKDGETAPSGDAEPLARRVAELEERLRQLESGGNKEPHHAGNRSST